MLEMLLAGMFRKLMNLFFQLLYHQLAWLYDLVSWSVSVGQWQHWILTPLPYLKQDTILELGYGPGHLQKAAHRQSYSIFGLDRSPQMAKIAGKRLRKSQYQPRLAIGDARALPYAEHSIGQIVATFPSEYFLDPLTLKEAHRVLKSEGELIVVPMAWIRGKTPVHMLLGWVFKITGQSLDKEHPLFEQGIQFLAEHGFEASLQTRELRNSEVLILIASKKTKT